MLKLSKQKILISIVGLAALLGLSYWLFFVYSPQNTMCIQVLQRARNPITKEERTFFTPCAVPIGWEKLSSYDESSTMSGSIEVVSPKGGEEWKSGAIQNIKWKFSPEMEKRIETQEILSLSIVINSKKWGSWSIHRQDNLKKDFTSLQWKVGNAGPMPGGFGQTSFYQEYPQPIPDSQYRIRICGGDMETFYRICNESNYFSLLK
ncbi:MAG: hypothetical protein HY454_03960 [Parcubacteria group bacterium]|nr:hypothetical protein [Parcubacteria group bacterium]